MRPTKFQIVLAIIIAIGAIAWFTDGDHVDLDRVDPPKGAEETQQHEERTSGDPSTPELRPSPLLPRPGWKYPYAAEGLVVPECAVYYPNGLHLHCDDPQFTREMLARFRENHEHNMRIDAGPTVDEIR